MDEHTDSLVLKSALESDGCRSSGVNNILKDIFDCHREFNFSLDAHYVPSSENPADFPSRKVSSVSLGPTPSTLCLWVAIVNAMEQASARSTLHLEQLRVLAGLIFLHSLCLRTTTCKCCHRLFYCAPSEMHSRSRFSRCIYCHYPGLEAWTLLVGVATVACCRSSSSGKEKRRWRFVVPLSSRSALVLQNSSMGSMGYRLCLLRLTCSHP